MVSVLGAEAVCLGRADEDEFQHGACRKIVSNLQKNKKKLSDDIYCLNFSEI